MYQQPIGQYQAPMRTQYSPTYVTNSHGIQVNRTKGLVKTETRGIFVGDIDYKARSDEVYAFFSRVGTVINVDMHKDAKGKPRGTAIVEFASAVSAQRACALNDERWMGRKLKVRLDTNTTPVIAPPTGTSSNSSRQAQHSAIGPTIVDGSQVRWRQQTLM